jgi:hypothetical protein
MNPPVIKSAMNPKPIVVVPIHKHGPTPPEVVSLRQLGRCLGNRIIAVLAPGGLDLSCYREMIPLDNIIRVNPKSMASIQAYNRLMISPAFFSSFSGFTHVLIHEPDAIVLRDDLDFWCELPFDYVGAPWFEGRKDASYDSSLEGVGNFGLSLHNLEGSDRVLHSRKRWYPEAAREFAANARGRRERIRRECIAILNGGGTLRGAHKLYKGHCDVFWCEIVPRVFPDYRIAPIDVAMNFSWEVQPRRCFALCNGQMPFGMHAWARYDLDFLAPKLLATGVDLTGLDEAHLEPSAPRSPFPSTP